MKRLLIANRGEIAVRIARTAARLGIETVVVTSEPDQDSLAARTADRAVLVGPAPAKDSYLDQDAVLEAARDTGCDAVHPGYGFLAENAAFAQKVIDAGLLWVGPDPRTIDLMGHKARAIEAAKAAGVPTLPGSDGPLGEDDDPVAIAEAIGYPLVVKASAGGGGRGIRKVDRKDDLLAAISTASAEAGAVFGDPDVYLERFVEHARHVEVQVLGDGSRAIHLGDRDCSMQRRSQKVLEEAPAPDLPDHVRDVIRSSSVHLAENAHYRGAGTVEFLYDPQRHEAAFIEMNTRLQVEHPVTEAVTGIDLVEWQLRVADGEPLSLSQDEVTFTGHAIECRLNAEDPSRDFFPSPGTVTALAWPEGVRVDSGVEAGSQVAPYYDSMLAKIIVHADTRDEAITATQRALAATTIEGVATTIGLHTAILKRPEMRDLTHHTTFIETAPDLLEGL